MNSWLAFSKNSTFKLIERNFTMESTELDLWFTDLYLTWCKNLTEVTVNLIKESGCLCTKYPTLSLKVAKFLLPRVLWLRPKLTRCKKWHSAWTHGKPTPLSTETLSSSSTMLNSPTLRINQNKWADKWLKSHKDSVEVRAQAQTMMRNLICNSNDTQGSNSSFSSLYTISI